MIINVKRINNKITYTFLAAIFLTTSFDIFLNLNVGGFSLRMVFILIIFFIGITFFHFIMKKQLILRFIGWEYFILWVFLLVLFIFNTNIIARNIAYMIWLTLYAMFILALNQYQPNQKTFLYVIKMYIFSFKALAIFGILQFTFGIFGFNIYITDWWIINKFPRINGFTYEPSYFSTYLIIGWIIVYYLYRKNISLIKYFNIKSSLILISLGLILTTSRLGILIMLLLFIYPYITSIIRKLLMMKLDVTSLLIIIFLLLFLLYFIFIKWEQSRFLFEGLGIGGTSSHSSSRRLNEFIDTLIIFTKSPVIGYSLGGIPSAIAELNGVIITSQAQTKSFEGMSIFAEVLAASGIIGFVFFGMFIIRILRTSFFIEHFIHAQKDLILIHRSLLYAFMVELIMLTFNQNILRAYLWIHIAIINYSFYSIINISSKLINVDEK